MKDLPPISYCSHGNPSGLHTWTFTAVLGKSRQVEKCLIPKTQKSQHGRGGIAQTKLSGQGQLHRLLRPYPVESEGLQRWASHSLLGPPVLDQPWGKKVFFYVQTGFPLFWHMSLVTCLLPGHHGGDSASVPLSLSQELFAHTALIPVPSAFPSVTFVTAMVLPCPSCPGELSCTQRSRVASPVPGRGAGPSPPRQECCASLGTTDPRCTRARHCRGVTSVSPVPGCPCQAG